MSSIALIGTGQIGSRYLQGLVKINSKIKILAVEPILQAQKSAQQRWIEAGGDKSGHEIEWVSDLNYKNSNIDLAIIATSSFNRSVLIKNVRLKINPKYWIIEKVLAQSKTEIDLIKSEVIKAQGAWVNTPRRLMTLHNQLKPKFYGQGPLRVIKSGALWGLACNSIHFIDLVSWWTGESLLSVNSVGLDRAWFKSKRSGYFDVSGDLFIKFSGGTELILRSNFESIEEVVSVQIFNNNNLWTIYEENGIASSSNGTIINGQLEYQSEITGPMVTQILNYGTCDLPTLNESSELHRIFLDSMLVHWNQSNNSNDKQVPIT
jgi:hypothetical protein